MSKWFSVDHEGLTAIAKRRGMSEGDEMSSEQLFEVREEIFEAVANGTADLADRKTLRLVEQVAPELVHRQGGLCLDSSHAGR